MTRRILFRRSPKEEAIRRLAEADETEHDAEIIYRNLKEMVGKERGIEQEGITAAGRPEVIAGMF